MAAKHHRFDTMIVKTLSESLYDIDSILEAANAVSNSCVFEMNREEMERTVTITFLATRPANGDLAECSNRFMDLLGRNVIRKRVRDRTHSIRELIVRQAFIEGEFSDEEC